jgi:hypothetical protein
VQGNQCKVKVGSEHQVGTSSRRCNGISHKLLQHNHQRAHRPPLICHSGQSYLVHLANPKCGTMPAQRDNDGLVYCLSFLKEMALSESAPGMCSVLMPGGIDRKMTLYLQH